MTINSSPDCWQMVVRDPSNLSGASVSSMILRLAEWAGSSAAVVCDVEGGGDSLRELTAGPGKCLEFGVVELAELASRMTQFDWADVFIGPHCAVPCGFGNLSCEQAVLQFALTLRCVDDEFFYIYGTDPRLREVLRAHLRPVEMNEGRVHELDFPA